MKFPYYQLRDGLIRPIIKIQVIANGKKIPYYALLDSGADMNIFHAEVAEALGIDITTGAKGYVAGLVHGKSQVFYTHDIELIVGGHRHNTTVAFMPTMSKRGHGLLGQKDFFNLFKCISFDYNKKEIELMQKIA